MGKAFQNLSKETPAFIFLLRKVVVDEISQRLEIFSCGME